MTDDPLHTGDRATDAATDREAPPEQSPNAARDHLANERTLLAWVRTGIAVMGLGFVVARFGLLVRELAGQPSHAAPAGTSTAFGTAFVLAGAALMALALVRYVQAGRAIQRNAFHWSPVLGMLPAVVLLIAGILLAIYLVITA